MEEHHKILKMERHNRIVVLLALIKSYKSELNEILDDMRSKLETEDDAKVYIILHSNVNEIFMTDAKY